MSNKSGGRLAYGTLHQRQSNVDLKQVQVMIGYTNVSLGSAGVVQRFEPWLYVQDADWSDLIKISDVTCTVYKNFVARADPSSERLRPVVRNVFLCSLCDYPTIKADKFKGGQIALSLIRYHKSKYN